MKIRIQDNSIRYRLTKSEVEHLLTEGEVTGQTEFHGGSGIFFYRLLESNGMHPCAEFSGGGITVHLPKEMMNAWATSDQVGISHLQDNEDKEGLSILIEKDFACLVPRGKENASDYYPNPNQEA